MKNNIIDKLTSLGYKIDVIADDFLITFILEKVSYEIKNNCNTSTIPQALEHTFIDMVCGEFLLIKKQSGKLLDFDAMVQQISTGDTSVSFDMSQSPEHRLDLLISFLMTRRDFSCYRKLKW